MVLEKGLEIGIITFWKYLIEPNLEEFYNHVF